MTFETRLCSKFHGLTTSLKNSRQVRAALTYFRLSVFIAVHDTRRNHWPIGEQFSRIWGLFVKRNSPNRSSHLTPSVLNSVTKENRCVAVMFIEHDFGRFAGIKREPARFNEPKRCSRAGEFTPLPRKGTGGTVNENLICRSIPSEPFCLAIRPTGINSRRLSLVRRY